MKKKTNTKVNDQLFNDLKRNRENIVRDENMFDYVETFPSIDSYFSFVQKVIQNKEDDPIFPPSKFESQPENPSDVSRTNNCLKRNESLIKKYVETFPSFDSFVNHLQTLMSIEKEKEIDKEFFKINEKLLTQLETLDEVKEEISKCIHSMTSNEMINRSNFNSRHDTTINNLIDIHERYRETLISCIQIKPQYEKEYE